MAGWSVSMGTRATMSFRLSLSGLNQLIPRHNSLARGWRLRVGGPANSARSSVIFPAVKSMAALDPTGNVNAMGSRLRFLPIDHGSQCDKSSGGRPPLCADAVGPARDVNTTARPNEYLGPSIWEPCAGPSSRRQLPYVE